MVFHLPKQHMIRLMTVALTCGLLAPLTGLAATPVAYPLKPIRFIVPFAAGGGTDLMARTLAARFTETWGQPVVVDNRAGGNGNIGTDMAAKAPADGYTLLFNTNATLVINPHMSKLGYDPVRDFAPVTQAAALPFVLLLHPSVPAKSVADLIGLIKAKPGEFNYGSSGNGGGAHLSGEMLKTMTKLEMTHIPYKGSSPATIALLGGEVKFMFVSILAATPLIDSGKVRVISVTSRTRSPSLPHVPAVAESPGLAGFETDLWYGMLAPAKTPAAVVDKLYQETRRILFLPEVRHRFEPTGTVMIGNTPAEFAKIIRDDLTKWAVVIKSSGARIE